MRILFSLLLFLVVSSNQSFGQTRLELAEEGQQLLDQYIVHYELDEYEEAQLDMDAGIALLEGQGNDTLLGKFYNLYTYFHFMEGDKVAAFDAQKRAVELFQSGFGNQEPTAFALYNLAYLWKAVYGNVDSSAAALSASLTIYEALEMPLDVAECYRSIGQNYDGIWEYQKAEEAYLKGIAIFETLPEKHPEIFAKYRLRAVRTQAWSYYNLSSVYGEMENLRESLIYMQRSQDLLDAHADYHPDLAMEAQVNRNRLLQLQGNHEGAIAALETALDDPEIDEMGPGYRSDILLDIAGIYAGSLREYDKGAELYRAFIEQEVKTPSIGPSQLLAYMEELIKCYLNLNELELVDQYTNQARQLATKLENEEVLTNLMVYTAKTQQLRGACNTALETLNKAIDRLSGLPTPRLGRLWRFRAELLRCEYERTEDMELLSTSLHWSDADLALLAEYEKRQFQQRSYGPRFRRAVEQQLAGLSAEYAAYGKDSSLQQIFSWLDQSRARSLRLGNQWEYSLRARNYPAELASEWNEKHRLQLQLLNEQYELQRLGNDSLKLLEQTDSLAQLTIKIEALERQMQAIYPIDVRPTALEELQQQLPDDQSALLMYFLGDSILTTMGVSRESTVLAHHQLKPEDRQLWEELNLAVRSQAGAADLGPLLHQAYQQLVEPLLRQLPSSINQLYLVPDGKLCQLPWAAFCQTIPTDDDFRTWPYLLQDYSLHFLSFAGELSDWQRRVQHRPTVAAFAPQYPPNPALDSRPEVAALMRDDLWALPGAAQEAAEIADLHGPQTSLLSPGLNKAEFRKIINRYDLLHLAMHALADPRDPSQSYLLFPPDSSADDHLTALELLSDELRAELVVLSACYSGDGPWRAGEGVMSLAYALRQSGVASVLSNNWAVADQFSSALMLDFHRGLRSGLPLVEALSEAQRSYLQQANPIQSAHPFYWAGFQLQGNPSPVYKRSQNWWWLLITIPVFGAVALYLKKRPSASPNTLDSEGAESP